MSFHSGHPRTHRTAGSFGVVTRETNHNPGDFRHVTQTLSDDEAYVMKGKTLEVQQYVSYLRVSTERQGQSGLGLEAQRQSVTDFVRQRGGTVIREFVEVESGRNNKRPRFAEALALASRADAKLLVAKLDRLSRNADFLSHIMQANVDFQAIDIPDANRLTIRIMAAVAEHEAELISNRTRDALQAAKRRGVQLGSARPGHWQGREERRRAGSVAGASRSASTRREKAEGAYLDIVPVICELRDKGQSLAEIALALNESGVPTRKGRRWQATQVWRVLNRLPNTPLNHGSACASINDE